LLTTYLTEVETVLCMHVQRCCRVMTSRGCRVKTKNGFIVDDNWR